MATIAEFTKSLDSTPAYAVAGVVDLTIETARALPEQFEEVQGKVVAFAKDAQETATTRVEAVRGRLTDLQVEAPKRAESWRGQAESWRGQAESWRGQAEVLVDELPAKVREYAEKALEIAKKEYEALAVRGEKFVGTYVSSETAGAASTASAKPAAARKAPARRTTSPKAGPAKANEATA